MKRKSIITTIAACLCLCLSAGIFAACTDDNGGDGGEDKGTLYSIQAPAASDVFTVTGLPENAYEGDTVTFQVTLSDPENSAVISVEAGYDELTADANGNYSFTMPAKPVTVSVDARAFSEVLSDGIATFSALKNTTTIAQTAGNTSEWLEDESKFYYDLWAFSIDISGAGHAMSDRSSVISSDQSVIPDDAITLEAQIDSGMSGSGLWLGATVTVDTAKINPGKTWLEMYFRSDANGSEGTVCVQITVVPYGEIEIATVQKTLVIDVSALDAKDGDPYTMHFSDKNYIDGGNAQEYFDVTSTVADGKVTFTFTYSVLHKYSIAMSPGSEYDYEHIVAIDHSAGGGIVTGEESLYDGYTASGLMYLTEDSITLTARPND